MWTAEQDRALLEHIASGCSASQAALRMGVTRNAVIGRLHRIKRTVFPFERRRRERSAEKRAEAETARTVLEMAAIDKLMLNLGDGMSRRRAAWLAHEDGARLDAIGVKLGVSGQRAWQLVHAGKSAAF